VVTPASPQIDIPPVLFSSIDRLGERTADSIEIVSVSSTTEDMWKRVPVEEIKHPTQLVSTSTSIIPTQHFRFTQRMTLGARGTEVRQLQRILTDLGFFPSTVPPSGYFGTITKDAVKKFQQANSIPTLGIVGPKTVTALNHFSNRTLP
jgi:murein L,D-transpeptidase YcbB/YkuD